MSTPAFSTADVLAALERMNSDERAEWVALVKSACANLSNAEYAFAGKSTRGETRPRHVGGGLHLARHLPARARRRADYAELEHRSVSGMTTPAAPRRDGAGTLDDVRDALTRCCILPGRHAYTAVTLFCAYTHAAAVFDFAPRLVLTSPEKRSGKTRCLEIIHQLAHKPMSTANASTAALYRSLAEPRTVLLDEADTIFSTRLKAEQHEDLRGLLNAGFQRGTPVVRWDASKRELEEPHTFAPVVVACA